LTTPAAKGLRPRFSGELEREFRDEYYAKSPGSFRMSLVLGALIYGLFGALPGRLCVALMIIAVPPADSFPDAGRLHSLMYVFTFSMLRLGFTAAAPWLTVPDHEIGRIAEPNRLPSWESAARKCVVRDP
jgi:hypothetical protein